MLSTALREIFDKEENYEKEVECLLVFYRRNVAVHCYELMYCGMRRGPEKSAGQSFRWDERTALGWRDGNICRCRLYHGERQSGNCGIIGRCRSNGGGGGEYPYDHGSRSRRSGRFAHMR